MSTDISREAAEVRLAERLDHFRTFSHEALARHCAELEREKLQLDFEWQDEFSELQRATAALREENACFRAILKGEEYEELDGMVTEGQLFCLQLGQAVAKNTKKIMAERAELRAECERLRAQLNSANQQHQL